MIFQILISYALLAVCAAWPQWPAESARDRNFRTISNIYNLTIYPNQLPIVLGGGSFVPAGLFAPNATGRISPVGNFTSFEDSIEYFFALPPLPVSNPNSAAFVKFDIVEFSSECAEIAATTTYLTAAVVDPTSADNGKVITYLKQTGFWKFNDCGEVIDYDLALIELNSFTSELLSADFTNAAVQNATIEGVCENAQRQCTGPNAQYSSYQDCVDTLHKKVYGTYDNVWSDTVVCRTIHILLTLVRPDVHCPHVGPTGGMKCVNYDYKDREFNDLQLFGAKQPFKCPKPKTHWYEPWWA